MYCDEITITTTYLRRTVSNENSSFVEVFVSIDVICKHYREEHVVSFLIFYVIRFDASTCILSNIVGSQKNHEI